MESYAFYDTYVFSGGIVLPDTLKYIGSNALIIEEDSSNDPPLPVYSLFGRAYRAVWPSAAIRHIRSHIYRIERGADAEFLSGWDSNAQVTYKKMR